MNHRKGLHPDLDPGTAPLVQAKSGVGLGAYPTPLPPWATPARSGVREVGLTLAYHPDLTRIGQRAALPGLMSGQPCSVSRLEPAFEAPSVVPAPLGDHHVSRQAVTLHADGRGGVHLSAESSRVWYTLNGRLGSGDDHVTAAQLERGVVLGLGDRVLTVLGVCQEPLALSDRLGMLGCSDALEQVRHDAQQLAVLDVPVLIRGETGSGKERVARAIHAASRRAGKPFVAVNMAAIAPAAAASELFGHKRGAFTDAVADTAGFFGQADGGTLFLDEVGEAPVHVQVMLLRALDEGQIQPVGGAVRTVNVRLLAATDADLETEVQQGRFRDTLLHRIQVCSIEMPPLRRRREDVALLFVHFLRKQLTALGLADRLQPATADAPVWLTPAVMADLLAQDWPGNVRQLRNVATEMAVRSGRMDTAQIPPTLYRARRARKRPPSGPFVDDGEPQTEVLTRAVVQRNAVAAAAATAPLTVAGAPEASPTVVAAPLAGAAQATPERIAAALREHGWNLMGTARALGIAKNTLTARMRAFGIDRPSTDLSAAEIDSALELCDHDLSATAAHLHVSQRALGHRLAALRRAVHG